MTYTARGFILFEMSGKALLTFVMLGYVLPSLVSGALVCSPMSQGKQSFAIGQQLNGWTCSHFPKSNLSLGIARGTQGWAEPPGRFFESQRAGVPELYTQATIADPQSLVPPLWRDLALKRRWPGERRSLAPESGHHVLHLQERARDVDASWPWKCHKKCGTHYDGMQRVDAAATDSQ